MKNINTKLKKLLILIRNLIAKNKILILAIFMVGLIFDILINPKISDSMVLILIAFWIVNISNLKLKPVYSLSLAIFAYLLSFITQFFGNEMVVEKGASWFFVFLSIALIQRLIEGFSKNEKKA